MFLAAKRVQGSFDLNGFVGLGPQKSGDDQSFVAGLFNQKQIDSMKVGLNYENNLDKDRASTITFGFYDLNNVKNGEEGLNWYLNVGADSWAVWLDDIKLDGKDIQTRPGAKVAHIDSANLFI